MTITVKKGKHGYYVDQPRYAGNGFDDLVEDVTFDRSSIVIFIEYNQKGCDNPLKCAGSWGIQDSLDRKLILVIGTDQKLIDVIHSNGHETVSEFTLDENHGFWFFCNGVPLPATTPSKEEDPFKPSYFYQDDNTGVLIGIAGPLFFDDEDSVKDFFLPIADMVSVVDVDDLDTSMFVSLTISDHEHRLFTQRKVDLVRVMEIVRPELSPLFGISESAFPDLIKKLES